MIDKSNHIDESTAQAATAPVDDLFTDTPPGIVKSMQAYLRELPTLLANRKHDRWWVCYHGCERIGIAYSGRKLLRECAKRGLREDEIYIGIIQKQDPEEWTGLELH